MVELYQKINRDPMRMYGHITNVILKLVPSHPAHANANMICTTSKAPLAFLEAEDFSTIAGFLFYFVFEEGQTSGIDKALEKLVHDNRLDEFLVKRDSRTYDRRKVHDGNTKLNEKYSVALGSTGETYRPSITPDISTEEEPFASFTRHLTSVDLVFKMLMRLYPRALHQTPPVWSDVDNELGLVKWLVSHQHVLHRDPPPSKRKRRDEDDDFEQLDILSTCPYVISEYLNGASVMQRLLKYEIVNAHCLTHDFFHAETEMLHWSHPNALCFSVDLTTMHNGIHHWNKLLWPRLSMVHDVNTCLESKGYWMGWNGSEFTAEAPDVKRASTRILEENLTRILGCVLDEQRPIEERRFFAEQYPHPDVPVERIAYALQRRHWQKCMMSKILASCFVPTAPTARGFLKALTNLQTRQDDSGLFSFYKFPPTETMYTHSDMWSRMGMFVRNLFGLVAGRHMQHSWNPDKFLVLFLRSGIVRETRLSNKNRGPNTLVVGAPNSGKTTVLKNVNRARREFVRENTSSSDRAFDGGNEEHEEAALSALVYIQDDTNVSHLSDQKAGKRGAVNVEERAKQDLTKQIHGEQHALIRVRQKEVKDSRGQKRFCQETVFNLCDATFITATNRDEKLDSAIERRHNHMYIITKPLHESDVQHHDARFARKYSETRLFQCLGDLTLLVNIYKQATVAPGIVRPTEEMRGEARSVWNKFVKVFNACSCHNLEYEDARKEDFMKTATELHLSFVISRFFLESDSCVHRTQYQTRDMYEELAHVEYVAYIPNETCITALSANLDLLFPEPEEILARFLVHRLDLVEPDVSSELPPRSDYTRISFVSHLEDSKTSTADAEEALFADLATACGNWMSKRKGKRRTGKQLHADPQKALNPHVVASLRYMRERTRQVDDTSETSFEDAEADGMHVLTSRVEDVNGSAQRFLYVQTRWIWIMYDRTRTFKGILRQCAISQFRIPLLWPLAHRSAQGKVTMTLWEPDYLEPTEAFSRDAYALRSWKERCRLFGSEALEADIRSVARWRGEDPSTIYEHFESVMQL